MPALGKLLGAPVCIAHMHEREAVLRAQAEIRKVTPSWVACFGVGHRGPQGPNEDLDICTRCGRPTWRKRRPNETYGLHIPDCSLPIDHESHCEPGGEGHPPAEIIRGYWPNLQLPDRGVEREQ